MTDTVDVNINVNDETAERPFLVRDYAAKITPGDGRTVDVRIIPFGERITHNDGFGGVPRGVDYQEEWLPGAFRHQLKAADKVLGNYEHMQGPQGLVARATALREEPDGYHATFRMLDGSDADKTLELIREGVLDGVSIEAQPVKSSRTAAGVVQRLRANLRAVAFTRFAAYAGARVLAVREDVIEDEVVIDANLLPITIDPDLVARCREAGVRLPQRYLELTRAAAGSLAKLLNGHIDEMGDRSATVAKMASEAGIESATVGEILNGSISCPPLDRLRGFARALNISAESVVSAAKEDGCMYEQDNA